MPQTLLLQPAAARRVAHATEAKQQPASAQPIDPSEPGPAPAFTHALKDQTAKIKSSKSPQADAKSEAPATNAHREPAKPDTESAGASPPHARADATADSKGTAPKGAKDASPAKTETSLDPSHAQSLVAYVNQSHATPDNAQANDGNQDISQTAAAEQAAVQESPSAPQQSAPAVTTSPPQVAATEADANAAKAVLVAQAAPATAATAATAAAQPAQATDATSATPSQSPAPAAQDPEAPPPATAPATKPDANPPMSNPHSSATASAPVAAASSNTKETGWQSNVSDQQGSQQNPQQDPSTQAPAPFKSAASKDSSRQPQPTYDASANSQTNAPATDSTPAGVDAMPSLAANIASTVLADSASTAAPAKPTATGSGGPSPILGGATAAPQPQATSASSAAAAQQSPASSHENVLDQVVLGLRGKLDPQNGKAEIRLDPPNLGSLKVSIALNKGSLTAQFETSTDVVRDLLSNHIDKLRSVLEGQGITVDRLAVQTQTQAQPQTSDQRSSGSSNHDGRSAGGYEQNRRGAQRDPTDQTFASTFQQVRETPMDVLA